MELNWNQIKVFYHVSKAGSISLGAQRLNLSPSAVTKSIQELEHRAHVKLFHRHTRGITLTPEGEKIYLHASKMYNEYEDMQAAINSEKNEVSGILRVITSAGLASFWLLEAMIKLAKNYPNLKLKIYGIDDDIDLNDSLFDIAIKNRISDNVNFVQEQLTSFKMGLYASGNYLAKRGVPKNIEDLDSHCLLSFGSERQHTYGDVNWHLTLGAPKGQVRQSIFEFNSSLALVRAAENDLGIIVMPDEHPLLKNNGLVNILPEVRGFITEAYFVYPKHLKNSKKIDIFISYMKEAFV